MIEYYTKRPLTIRAIQWTGENTKEIIEFCPKAVDDIAYILIPTLEGFMKASPGDYIIKGIRGECYPCKPDIFLETYDKAEL